MEDSSFNYEFDDSEIQFKSINLVKGGHLENSIFQPSSDYNKIVLSVRDEGIGIAKKDVKHIHKLFGFQRMKSQSIASGIGVGLAACKFITERYGGMIKVYSRPKYGSLF